MKLSTNSRYGLRAMVDLASNYVGEPISLCSIARRQCVSESYLEQVFALLRKAGFVRSAKGAQGGYSPALDSEQVTAGTILRSLEGSISVIEDSSVFTGSDPIKRCIRENVWHTIDARIAEILDSVSLADLARECARMRGNAQDYQI